MLQRDLGRFWPAHINFFPKVSLFLVRDFLDCEQFDHPISSTLWVRNVQRQELSQHYMPSPQSLVTLELFLVLLSAFTQANLH